MTENRVEGFFEPEDSGDKPPTTQTESQDRQGPDRIWPYKDGQEVRTAARKYVNRTTKQFQRDRILARLEKSGALGAEAVPCLMDAFVRLPIGTRHRLLDFYFYLLDEGADLGEIAEPMAAFLNDSNFQFRERVGEFLIRMGSAAEPAAMRALGCTRNGLREIRLLGVRVLAGIGTSAERAARKRLEQLLASTPENDTELREATEEALRALRGEATPNAEEAEESEAGIGAKTGAADRKALEEGTRVLRTRYPHVQGARILVAEDEEKPRRVIAAVLRKVGGEVVEAADGAQALAALSGALHDGPRFDLLLTDLMMPGANGLDLLQKLRQAKDEENGTATPVVVMSGIKDRDTVGVCLRMGVTQYLLKPLQVTKVLDAVNTVLGAVGGDGTDGAEAAADAGTAGG